MNAKQKVRRRLWDLTTDMERLQELYGFVSRDLPSTFGDFYESLMAEIEHYDKELSYEHD